MNTLADGGTLDTRYRDHDLSGNYKCHVEQDWLLVKEQFDMELQKGMDDIAAGCVVSADAVEAEIRSLYGV